MNDYQVYSGNYGNSNIKEEVTLRKSLASVRREVKYLKSDIENRDRKIKELIENNNMLSLEIQNMKDKIISEIGIPESFLESAIVYYVCHHYEVSFESLKTGSRKQVYVAPRRAIMFFLRKYTKLSFSAIGKMFNRDHATALHSCAVVEDFMSIDKKYKEEITEMNNAIQEKVKELDEEKSKA